MTIRVKHVIAVQTSTDTDQTRKMFYLDPDNESVISDSVQKQASGNLEVAIGGSETLSFGDVVDVRGFYLEVATDCRVRLNGSSDNIELKVVKDATPSKAKLFIEADLSQIEVDNTQGTVALTGIYCLWGDPTA